MEAWVLPRDAAPGMRPHDAAALRAAFLSPRWLRSAPDARLVALLREGHAAAFEAIYDRYQRPVLAFCRHILGDREEAADAVQQTFMAAYTSIVSSRRAILLRAWLFTIARNRCYSMLRARRERPTAATAEPATEALAAHVLRREDLRQLLRDVSRLPDEQRSALLLGALGALSHQQIAGLLGVPQDKVKALVFQGRASLIGMRAARDTDCGVIRDQLLALRGGALRRGNLRRHLRDCAGCREFRDQITDRAPALAAIPAA